MLRAALLVACLGCACATLSFPNGSNQACTNEGQDWLLNMPSSCTYTCKCKNGVVQCEKEQCVTEKGCFMLQDTGKDSCCRVCKGCLVDGVARASDTQWQDPKDPCRVMSCKAGVLTESNLQCYTPCRNPVSPGPGQCCATCPGCWINGQDLRKGHEVTITEDPCVKCRCEQGRTACTKQACPVLHCPGDKVVTPPGECCPQCNGSRQSLEPPNGKCMVGYRIHRDAASFHVDQCTSCRCANGTSLCRRTTCPVLDCPLRGQVKTRHCCPHCDQRLVEELRATCSHGGRTYEEGDRWKINPCHSCTCVGGQPICYMERCPAQNQPCPPNHRWEQDPGQCCPRCVENDGVCTVFGDPHYRTFDGKFYSFQGSCKYLMAGDCEGRSFNIRVTNDAKSTKTSSWTKTISMKVGSVKVNLLQKMRVKVNGKRVEAPYSLDGQLTINRTDDSLLVHTSLGVKVLWDGSSFLEVSAPTSYKGKLCGLCGNYNGLRKDDFTSRHGKVVASAERFGQAWRVGAKKACGRRHEDARPERRCADRSTGRFNRDTKLCKRLRNFALFGSCHGRVNPALYIESCMVDMCECPNARCYCDSFTAYAHECRRLGVKLSDEWRREAKCPSGWARVRPAPRSR
ncbi:BMP-binding endothelial regulator protein [Bacillus rossius redtenbacheri]|uniref:BMP-binding endothelial regulator protein n=1 Tax=Bacillus rossius redtenbacheri TaxID=93214 RepID=UPI002FDE1E1D